jgi:hypothetical protein
MWSSACEAWLCLPFVHTSAQLQISLNTKVYVLQTQRAKHGFDHILFYKFQLQPILLIMCISLLQRCFVVSQQVLHSQQLLHRQRIMYRQLHS